MKLTVEDLFIAIEAVEASHDGIIYTIDELKDYLKENEGGYVEITTEERFE